MPRFEVVVPAAPPARPLDVTVRLEADSWLAALKSGLERAGDPGPATAHLLCDVQADGSILVSDPRSDRLFRIREARAAPPAPAAPEPRPAGAPAPSGSRPRPARRGGDDVLAELFERVQELERHRDRKGGLTFLLDLALGTVGAEAGSAFTAQLAGRDLAFAVARGPAADRILRLGLTVPVGVGVVGFCARENVCVAVSDAQRDPRFHRAISQAIGYETRSILCAPMAREGRVLGALELLNKTGGRAFDGADVAALEYLAHQAAEFLARLEG